MPAQNSLKKRTQDAHHYSFTDEREFQFSEDDFKTISHIIYDLTGIVLASNKYKMVYSRLVRRVRALGCEGFKDYVALIRSKDGAAEIQDLVNAITTNLTKFFRETHHFDHLKTSLLPSYKARASRLRIWSAGCSTGEEPYSIAMSLMEALPDWRNLDARILATDLDTQVIAHARTGRYDALNLGELPKAFVERYFNMSNDKTVTVKPSVSSLITFKQLNLLNEWPMKGPFDAIFCRNVMIYFDNPTKTALINRFATYLRPGGFLYIGHSETLLDRSNPFKLMGRTIYQKPEV